MNFDEKLKFAQTLVKEDKYLEAFDVYCELRYERPHELHLLATAAYLFGQIQDAYYDFVPETALDYLFRGVARFYKGELLNSIDDYDLAISLDPKLDAAHYYKAISLRDMDENTKAIEETRKALKLLEHGTYYDELAENLFRLGFKKESLEAHELAILTTPGDSRLWFNYGAHLSKAGYNAEAVKKLRKTKEMDPLYPNVQRVLDYVLAKMPGN